MKKEKKTKEKKDGEQNSTRTQRLAWFTRIFVNLFFILLGCG
jgi:hypothetical protein